MGVPLVRESGCPLTTRAYMDMEHLYSMERDQEEKALELPMSV